jgi:hypothetical protein
MHDRGRAGQPSFGLVAVVVLGVFFGLAAAAFAVTVGFAPSAGGEVGAHGAAMQPLRIAVTPARRVIAAGGTARYTVAIAHGARRSVRLGVQGRRPPGISIQITPRSPRSTRARLTVATSPAAHGRYRFVVRAVDGRRRARARLTLEVRARGVATAPPAGATVDAASATDAPSPAPSIPSPSQPATPPLDTPTDVTIAGSLSRPLSPGLALPLDLALTNRRALAIGFTGLDVVLESIAAPQADATHPCSADDFAVTQFSGAYGFTLAPAATLRLSQLGFAADEWPQVAMIDRPVNQDGCQRATLTFRFGATATEGPS